MVIIDAFIVAAMKPDEAPTSSRFTGEIPDLAATRETRADWGFCVSADRTPHDSNGLQGGCAEQKPINVPAITQPRESDKQTCPARGMRNSSAMPDSWLDVTRCHNPRIARRQAQRTGPPIALTRQGV